MQSLIDDERYDEAVSRCSALADRGLVFPQVWLGWMHLTGRGVQQNLTTAEDWFSRAAKQGSPHGQYWLGYICRVQHRLAEARYWLEEAAAQGDSPSIYEMGRLYLFGGSGGLEKDFDPAASQILAGAEARWPEVKKQIQGN